MVLSQVEKEVIQTTIKCLDDSFQEIMQQQLNLDKLVEASIIIGRCRELEHQLYKSEIGSRENSMIIESIKALIIKMDEKVHDKARSVAILIVDDKDRSFLPY